MKEEGGHLVRDSCLDCKILQCLGDLGKPCLGVTVAIYVDVLNFLV